MAWNIDINQPAGYMDKTNQPAGYMDKTYSISALEMDCPHAVDILRQH